MGRQLKKLFGSIFLLLLAVQAYANSDDVARIHELNPILDKDEIIQIANKVKQETDTRKNYGPEAPQFLETYGKLMVNGTLRCTGNIVAHDEGTDAYIVTTAAHCFKGNESKQAHLSIEFTKRDETVVQRNLAPFVINNEDDYAILKLDRPIPNTLLKPLLIADYPYDEIMVTENNNVNPYTVTFAGYSDDSRNGSKGKNLTYDQDCQMFNSRGYLVDTNCVGYPGESGGAFVITVTDRENNNKVTDYFVGVNHSISINTYADERPQVATFVEHSAMYDDLLEALGESR